MHYLQIAFKTKVAVIVLQSSYEKTDYEVKENHSNDFYQRIFKKVQSRKIKNLDIQIASILIIQIFKNLNNPIFGNLRNLLKEKVGNLRDFIYLPKMK